MFHIVLVTPEIPHNTGAAGRLALAAGAVLHLVKPLGFSLDDKYIRRTGLDYWQDVDVRVWENFEELQKSVSHKARFFYLSTKATKTLWETEFRDGDYLIFGSEGKGLPEKMVFSAENYAVKIPMKDHSTRSLNLATAIAIVLYEGERQLHVTSS
jgi:tRNA (cytidine/uridine-2'-O-)-methyltransferase